ncbi:MAG: aminodeoxychorismate synthase component I [Cocleimonas sp.]
MKSLSQIINGSEVFALLEDSKSSQAEARNLLFSDSQEDIIANTEAELPVALAKVDACRQQGLYLCGYLAYEAGYYFIDKKIKRTKENNKEQALLHFVAFKSMQELDRQTIDEAFSETEQDPSSQLCAHGFKLSVSKDKYLDAIKKIKNYIKAGDTYQINYTIKFKFRLRGTANALYQALRQTQPVEFGAFLNFPKLKIVSSSPELFVRRQDDTLISKPMKGTAKRGSNETEDEFIVDFLKHDPKTLSENVMIVDLIRNDFGRICKTGSVVVKNLFEVQTFKTIHQMISTVKGKLKSDISFENLLYGLFPCGSITGAPKIRTMEIINDLEAESRGVYTGAIGYILPNNDFYFNVPIRTIVMNKRNQCEMGIGSGIIHESNAKAEFEECILKADFLTNLNDNFYLIETFKYDTEKQEYGNLAEHICRLTDSAGYFGFKIKQHVIDERLAETKQELEKQNEIFKIRLCAYQNGEVNISYEIIPENDSLAEKKVIIGQQKISSRSIFQYHKTSRREVYNEEFVKASKAGYYEAIILNEHNEVAEACRHNLFIRKDGQLITPPIKAGVLHGIYRQKLIDEENVIEKVITLQDLRNADEILLTNSVRGLIKVLLE